MVVYSEEHITRHPLQRVSIANSGAVNTQRFDVHWITPEMRERIGRILRKESISARIPIALVLFIFKSREYEMEVRIIIRIPSNNQEGF